MNPTTLPALLQQFFTERLTSQMRASGNTISGYPRYVPPVFELCVEAVGGSPDKVKSRGFDLRSDQRVP
jgi:hypothetical protein